MAFKKGDKKPPNSGRAKGVTNKSKAVYQNDQDWVYEQLGGKEGWLAFVQKNPLNKAQFYKGIENKRIPATVEMTGKDGGPIDHAVNVKVTFVDTKG